MAVVTDDHCLGGSCTGVGDIVPVIRRQLGSPSLTPPPCHRASKVDVRVARARTHRTDVVAALHRSVLVAGIALDVNPVQRRRRLFLALVRFLPLSHFMTLDEAAACSCDFCATVKVLDVKLLYLCWHVLPLVHDVVGLYLVLYFFHFVDSKDLALVHDQGSGPPSLGRCCTEGTEQNRPAHIPRSNSEVVAILRRMSQSLAESFVSVNSCSETHASGMPSR